MKCILLSGSSRSGKTTLANLLVETGNFIRLITCTSRPKRDHEVGTEYNFVDKEFFQDKEKFFELEEVHGYFYGLTKHEVTEKLASGKHILWVLDPKGAYKMLTKHKQDLPPNTISIYVDPGRDIIIKRITEKNEHDKDKRLESLDEEYTILESGIFDYLLDTSCTVEESFEAISKIIAV